MIVVVIVIHLILVLAMIAVILLQKSEGGGLVSSTSGFMTGRGTANVLTRTTAILAFFFFITSLVLSWYAGPRPPSGVNHQSRRAGVPAGAGRRRALGAIEPGRWRRARPTRRWQSAGSGTSGGAERPASSPVEIGSRRWPQRSLPTPTTRTAAGCSRST